MDHISPGSLKRLIVVGDRILIKPKSFSEKTKNGLFLPPGYHEKESIQTGFVIKVGPGYPVPTAGDGEDEAWKPAEDHVKYIPLQAKEGDLAIFLQKGAIEIMYDNEKFYIVSQQSLLLLERSEDL